MAPQCNRHGKEEHLEETKGVIRSRKS
jgi:hypothetical protein